MAGAPEYRYAEDPLLRARAGSYLGTVSNFLISEKTEEDLGQWVVFHLCRGRLWPTPRSGSWLGLGLPRVVQPNGAIRAALSSDCL